MYILATFLPLPPDFKLSKVSTSIRTLSYYPFFSFSRYKNKKLERSTLKASKCNLELLWNENDTRKDMYFTRNKLFDTYILSFFCLDIVICIFERKIYVLLQMNNPVCFYHPRRRDSCEW